MNSRLTAVILGLSLVGMWASPMYGSPISPLRGVIASVQVGKDSRTGIFTYRYRVFNPATNDGQIRSVNIDLSRQPDEAELSREGLINGPRYSRHGSENAFQQVPMVPVGISGPEGWTSGLGFDDRVPPRGFAGWGSMSESFRILPGKMLEGFQLTSYGLPGIREISIIPAADPPEGVTEWEELNAFFEQLTLKTKAIGPKAPPRDFVPIEFLNYLITLVHDSRKHGWIRNDGVRTSLLAKLISAKRQLERGQPVAAKNIVNAFLHEVQAVSCPEFSCPGNKPLTSEAYALLFFNGQFLWERLR